MAGRNRPTRRNRGFTRLSMELLEDRWMLDAAVGHFLRINDGGGAAADSRAYAAAGYQSSIDDPAIQLQEMLAHNSATAIADDELGFGFGHGDGTGLVPTSIGAAIAVAQVSSDSIAEATAVGDALASGSSRGTGGGRFQYICDPEFTTNLVFHGHLFVVGAVGAISSAPPDTGAEAFLRSSDASIDNSYLLLDGDTIYGLSLDVSVDDPNFPNISIPVGNAASYHVHYHTPVACGQVMEFVSSNGSSVYTVSIPGESATATSTGASSAWGYVTGEGQELPPGDGDGDGDVDAGDYQIWNDGKPQADFDEDGDVDDYDLAIWAANTDELVVSTELDGIDGNYNFGYLSLREAIALAADANHPGHDTIFFAPWVQEIVLTSGSITFTNVANPVTIQGLGANRLTINANGASNVFLASQSQSYGVTIHGVKLKGATGPALNTYFGPALTLDGVEITGNAGGVVVAYNSLTISNSTIAENSGQAVSIAFASGNIFNTTISGNQTIGAVTAGLSAAFASVTLTNVTVTNNRADKNKTSGTSTATGGLFASALGTITLHNSIVVGNFAGAVTNSVAADIGRATAGYYPGSFGSTSSYNLIGTSPSGAFPSGNNNQLGVSAAAVGLLALADNGGPTRTHALSATSWPSMLATTRKPQRSGYFSINVGNDFNESLTATLILMLASI